MSKPGNTNPKIPQAVEPSIPKNKRADLLTPVQRLLDKMTPTLCETVFEQHRQGERDRKWTFRAVCLFWTAMILRHPPSLEHGVEETRKGRGRDKLWPYVRATARAFFKKAANLRPHLFQSLYEAFTAKVLPRAETAYASWMKPLLKKFPDILIVDGSRLDAVCHQLKILRKTRSKILPGCVTVFYDLFRGISRKVLFYPDAAEAELPRAQDALDWIAKGSLLMGDRLYASVQYFHLLASLSIHGLFRRNGTLTVRQIEVLSRRQGSRALLEDILVKVGSGQKHPKITLRLIRYRHQGRRLDLLTSVLDPRQLSAEQAVALYGLRWSIERMFLDVKETLDLHALYASHPNLVAQQVYATALVHTAFRIAQADIARKAKILPEQLSPAKLFPKLAQAALEYANSWLLLRKVEAMNPGIKLNLPSLHSLPSAYAKIESLLVRRRKGPRKRRRFCASRKRWKSFAHVSGGPTLLKSISVG